MRCWVFRLGEQVGSADGGFDRTIVSGGESNPVDENVERLAQMTRRLSQFNGFVELERMMMNTGDYVCLFGFFGGLSADGISYFAWTMVTSQ